VFTDVTYLGYFLTRVEITSLKLYNLLADVFVLQSVSIICLHKTVITMVDSLFVCLFCVSRAGIVSN